jgi:hypothetical protein
LKERRGTRESDSTLGALPGWGARIERSGMSKKIERLINAVMPRRPKMLTGLDQNGTWQRMNGLGVPVHTTIAPPAERTTLTRAVSSAKHGKPDDFRQDAGTDLVRGKEESAGRGGRRRQTPFCNGVDRMIIIQSERMQTSDWFQMTRRQVPTHSRGAEDG